MRADWTDCGPLCKKSQKRKYMTKFTVGERVCYTTGPRREGIIIAIIVHTSPRKKDRVRVRPEDGEIYEELAERMAYCSKGRK
jgi:hypothetical protein